MKGFRRIAIQVILILAVSAVIALLFLPLANTNWAEGMRTGIDAERSQEDFDGARADMPAALGWIMSFVKSAIFMVIPGIITIWIRRLVKGKTRSRSAAPA